MKSFKVTACCALIIAITSSTAVFAADDYSEPTPGASTVENKAIFDKDKDNIACKGSLCTLFSVTSNNRTFNITTYVGDGMPTSSGSGTTNYYGSTTGTTGATGTLGYGIEISAEWTHCVKNINVDKSVYDAVTTYMRELINTTPGEPSTYPQFTPAEQTMLLFYTTVMDLTKGATCN